MLDIWQCSEYASAASGNLQLSVQKKEKRVLYFSKDEFLIILILLVFGYFDLISCNFNALTRLFKAKISMCPFQTSKIGFMNEKKG